MPSLPPDVAPVFERFVLGPQKLRDAVDGLDPGLLNRPDSGGWSIRDIVIHFADTELVTAVRLRLILASESPRLFAYDEGVWKKRLNYLFRDPDAALSLFQQVRYTNAELLQQAARDSWTRTGQHEELGAVTIADILLKRSDHDDEHIGQIRAIREAHEPHHKPFPE